MIKLVLSLFNLYQFEKLSPPFICKKLKKCLINKYFFDINRDRINLEKGEFSWGW
jgi:hypothetical protein